MKKGTLARVLQCIGGQKGREGMEREGGKAGKAGKGGKGGEGVKGGKGGKGREGREGWKIELGMKFFFGIGRMIWSCRVRGRIGW